MDVRELRVKLDTPLTADQIEQAKRLRVEWLQVYNALKNTPGGGLYYIETIQQAEQCLAFLDALLEAQPTIN